MKVEETSIHRGETKTERMRDEDQLYNIQGEPVKLTTKGN